MGKVLLLDGKVGQWRSGAVARGCKGGMEVVGSGFSGVKKRG